MWDVKLLMATRSIEKAMAITLYRFLVCLAIAFAFVVAIFAGAGIAFSVGAFGSPMKGLGQTGGLVGFVVFGVIVYRARRHFLFSVRCTQIAAAVESMEGRSLPGGAKQVLHARNLVQTRFRDVAFLAGIDRRIETVLADLFHATPQVSGWMPAIPHLPTARLVNALVALPVRYTAAVILAFQLRKQEENIWRAGHEALVLYAQNSKVMLKNALILYALMCAGLIAVFVLMLVPIGWVEAMLPEPMGWWRYTFALLLTWVIKAGAFEPIAETSMTQLYFDVVKGQEPSPEWEQKLSRLSPSFQAIKQQALSEEEPDAAQTTDPLADPESGEGAKPPRDG